VLPGPGWRAPASRSLAGFRSPVRSGESPPPASSTLRGKQVQSTATSDRRSTVSSPASVEKRWPSMTFPR
jgi:hypothetical protein